MRRPDADLEEKREPRVASQPERKRVTVVRLELDTGRDREAVIRRRYSDVCTRASASSWQFHAQVSDAKAGETVVADQPARKLIKGREGRQRWPLRYIPNGRGRGIAADVRRNPVADHRAAGAARTGVTGKWTWCVIVVAK
jgi:hypothetical protein